MRDFEELSQTSGLHKPIFLTTPDDRHLGSDKMLRSRVCRLIELGGIIWMFCRIATQPICSLHNKTNVQIILPSKTKRHTASQYRYLNVYNTSLLLTGKKVRKWKTIICKNTKYWLKVTGSEPLTLIFMQQAKVICYNIEIYTSSLTYLKKETK